MTRRFVDHVALITGAGGGIGRATAIAFAREGATVVVNDVDRRGAEETVQQISAADGRALFAAADVSSAREVEAMVRLTLDRTGRLDCAVNNAAIDAMPALLHDTAEESFDRVIAVNLKGVWLCMKFEIPAMLRQGGGSIVNVSSAAGMVGLRTLGPYVASKHGVLGLTRTAALELGSRGIRVNAVLPGTVRTAMSGEYFRSHPDAETNALTMEPIGRIAAPEEIATTVLFLCSDDASFMTGHCMAVDGGMLAQAGIYPPAPGS